ncbi:hydroxyacylglutathione hydrolase [Candidatus Pelagibacter sp.]|nr:hydroxyacylglutathione hydrolase [Candidatus Pelagibacter sp.]
MKIKIIPCLQDNYSYLIIDEENNIACVVDPSEADPIIKYLESTKIKLKFILNTHHHFDHVGGNQKLKEKYRASVIGYQDDKERIPGIDILVNDQEIWIHKNFEAKIIHIPGHTLGHICFYFHKDKLVFTGDTLFSLGCGRIFEGTYSQMFDSLNKLKELPKNTKVFCGHEYTLQNSKFCITHDENNENLKRKINDIKIKLKSGLSTIPSTIKDELECNIFLRSPNVKTFSKLRDLKDNF